MEWISPFGVVAVLTVALASQNRGLDVSVAAPANQIVRTYLERIGFWAELANRGWAVAGDIDFLDGYEVEACLPVSPLTAGHEVDAAANRLHAALAGVIAPGMAEKIWTAAIELTQNAREHGSPCYVVVQTHTGRTSGTRGVHVAVADFGSGFAATLRPVLGAISDDDAITRAFDERVSGTGLPDRRFGLGFVLDEIDSVEGAVLTLVSRTAAVVRTAGTFHATTERVDFRGTLAEAYFPYEAPSS